jgi:protein ImuB
MEKGTLPHEASRPPLVTARKDQNALRVFALDERAEALGLKRGMGLADARAMHPGIEVVEADPAADRRLLEGLADWCDRYTPLVALADDDGLFLDISGCAHLFGGEQAMLDDILDRLAEQGFEARAAVASTPGAAWAAARFVNGSLIATGAEGGALAPLPLSALRIAPETRAGLESVGLRTVASIMTQPRAPFARRFGPLLLLRLDQALGHVEEAVSPRLPVPSLSVERQLAEPIMQIEDIERLVLLLGERLKADLERQGIGARSLALVLFRVDGKVRRFELRTSRPMREPALMRRLFHERLEKTDESLDAGFGFELVRLSVLDVAPFDNEQGDLSGRAVDDGADLALFADRVHARLGEGALVRHATVESHIPERTVRQLPFAEVVSDVAGCFPAGSARPDAARPIRLLARPEPVDVAAVEVPEGPPRHFRWRRASHRVVRAEGPERIAPEWWLEAQDAPTRDYFRVEDEAGRRYWLFREGLYDAARTPPRWFMQGLFQ